MNCRIFGYNTVRTELRTHTNVRGGMLIQWRNQAIQQRCVRATNQELLNFVVYAPQHRWRLDLYLLGVEREIK